MSTIKMIRSTFFQFILITISILMVLVAMPFANAETLQGLVIGVNKNEVEIKLNQRHTLPKTGDSVVFKMMTGGLELEAGIGIISKVSSDSVWVKVTDGNPDLDMQAFIETTSVSRRTSMSSSSVVHSSPNKSPFNKKSNLQKNKITTYQRSKSFPPDKTPVSKRCSFLRLSEGRTLYYPPKSKKDLKRIVRNAKKEMIQLDKGVSPRFVFDLRQLAVWTYNGIGVPKNLQKGANLFRYAAKGGDTGAQFDIGVLYQVGSGVPEDINQARQWYEKSIGSSKYYPSPPALHNLGCMYLEGNGVRQDKAKAIKFFKQAASGGGYTGGFPRSIDMLSLLGVI